MDASFVTKEGVLKLFPYNKGKVLTKCKLSNCYWSAKGY